RVPAVDADDAWRATGQLDQRRTGELARVRLVHGHVAGVPMVLGEVRQEALAVTLPRPVDVAVLVLEQIERDGALARPAQQRQQDEQLPVVHADLGDRTGDAGLALVALDRVYELDAEGL